MVHRFVVTVETSTLHLEPITEGGLLREISSNLEYDAHRSGIVSITVEGTHMMTRRHFQQFAEMFHSVRTSAETIGERAIVRVLENRMADHLAADNPRFNRQRFLDACHKGDTAVPDAPR